MKLLSDAPTRRLLQRLSRGDRYGWIEIVALALLATQLARLVWAMLTPMGPFGDWRGRILAVPPMAQRQALFTSLDPFFRGTDPAAAAAPIQTVTPLNLTLFGVTVNQASGGGSAIIAGAEGVQTSYVVGQEIEAGAKLVGVAFDYVTVDRGGQREVLYIDQDRAKAAADASAAANAAPTPGAGEGTIVLPPGSPPPPVPTPGTPNAGLTPTSLRAGIGFAPRAVGGQVTGVVVSSQGDGRIFRQAGLQPGDVIRSVNGQTISSAADLARLQSQLAPGARLTLGVERGAGVANVAINLDAQ